MTSLTHQLEEIRASINSGHLEHAQALLHECSPDSALEHRVLAHYQGIILFHRSLYSEACEVMQKALDEYGENANLLRDLIACQYHRGDMIGFRAGLNRLEIILVEHETKLSQRTLFECEIMVGKFLEEEGRLAPSILFFEKALARAENPEQRLRVLLHKARWMAIYEIGADLSSLYRDLISFPLDKTTQDLRVELQHALMLIELRLVGSEHAWQRVARMGSSTYEFDRRLLIFDYLEGVLAQDLDLQPEVLNVTDQFENLSPFELYLKKLIQEPLESTTKIQELSVLATKLTWSSYLRLLCLTANREQNPSAKQELNRKIQLIVRSLDHQSQSLWNSRLKQALQNPEIRVEFSTRNRSLTVQGKVIDLNKKKMGLQMLEGLSKKSPLSVDEVIDLLWQSSFSPEHYHRLRMGIHRLNALVNDITGLGKIIEVDSQIVRLRPEVKLRPADEGFEVDLV